MKGSEIRLNNLSENETVNYRLVIIKGSIIKNNLVCGDVNGNIECSVNEQISSWPIHNGDFKCLAHLSEGANIVILNFSDASKVCKIIWTVHDTEYSVVPIYFIPEGHNGCFQAPADTDNSIQNAVAKIGFGIIMIQSLFAEKLKEHNYERKSFQIESDIDSTAPLCRVFKSKLSLEKATSLNEEELWEEVGRELMMSDLGNEKKKFICFISSTYWDGKVVTTDPALGGGGLALLGSASLHSWPSSVSQVVYALTNNKPLESCLLDNSCNRGTYSGVLATSLGSAAHEIGHTFNLGHTRSGLMARGFDNTHLVFIQTPSAGEKEREDPCLTIPSGTQIPITLSTYLSEDLTHLEPGCAAILAHHKWFNPTTNTNSSIHYDRIRHVMVSDGGLRVVEVRGSNGAVRRSWVLRGSGQHLVIPTGHAGNTLIAVDANGTILTETV